MRKIVGAAATATAGILIGSITEITANETDFENHYHEGEISVSEESSITDTSVFLVDGEGNVIDEYGDETRDLVESTFEEKRESLPETEAPEGSDQQHLTESNLLSLASGEVSEESGELMDNVKTAEIVQADQAVLDAPVFASANAISPEKNETPVMNGIDISHWQNGIDLNKIEADFILCKASGGNGYKDPDFKNYADSILNSGKLLGFYHFAQDNGYAGSADEEAEFFYTVTRDYVGKGLPVLDWEGSALIHGPSWAKSFLDRYYALSGVKCLIYMSASTTRDWDWGNVAEAGYQLWLAQYAYGGDHIQNGYEEDPWTDGKGTGAFDTALMHQYSSGGKLPGYEGRLDLDIFYGTREDWIDLCKSNQSDAVLYRLYNRITGEHLYTLSAYERDVLKNGDWNYEGIAWRAPVYSGSAVYRLYNRRTGDHHYTTSPLERDSLRTGDWNYEGIAWYSAEGDTPVYRLYNPSFTVGSHHFTTSYYEYQSLKQYGWNQEGIAWYGCEERNIKQQTKKEVMKSPERTRLNRSASSQPDGDYFERLLLSLSHTHGVKVSNVLIPQTNYLETAIENNI